jgi:hypothetical protein
MSVLTNQTSVNPTASFFAPNSQIIPINIQNSIEPLHFVVDDSMRIANVPIPSSYTSDNNYIFCATVALTNITAEQPLSGLVNISVSTSNVAFVNIVPFPLFSNSTSAGGTLPPFIANIGSNGGILAIDATVKANIDFNANYLFVNSFFMKLSSGGVSATV